MCFCVAFVFRARADGGVSGGYHNTSSPLMAGAGGHVSPGVPIPSSNTSPMPLIQHQGSLTVLQPAPTTSSPVTAPAYTVLPSFGQYTASAGTSLFFLQCRIDPRKWSQGTFCVHVSV
jgi:hypothetical protein